MPSPGNARGRRGRGEVVDEHVEVVDDRVERTNAVALALGGGGRGGLVVLVVVVEEPLASGEAVRHGAKTGEGDTRRVREAHALGEVRVIVRGVAAAVEEEEEVQVVAVGRRRDASVGVRPSARGRLQGVEVRRGDGRDLAPATLRRGPEKARAHAGGRPRARTTTRGRGGG